MSTFDWDKVDPAEYPITYGIKNAMDEGLAKGGVAGQVQSTIPGIVRAIQRLEDRIRTIDAATTEGSPG